MSRFQGGDGRILNQSFGFLTPGEIARGLVPAAHRSTPRVSSRGPVRLESEPKGATGTLRVYRDRPRHDERRGSETDMGDVLDDYGASRVTTTGPDETEQVRQNRQAMAQRALSSFQAEADRLKGTASRGAVDQAEQLLSDAWDHWKVDLQESSGWDVYPEYQDGWQYYLDSRTYMESFRPGAAQLQASTGRATSAVVTQNVAYEASGQAEADRQEEARSIARYQAGAGGFKGIIDASFGVTPRETSVTVAAGGRDPGYLGTAGRDLAERAPKIGGSIADAFEKFLKDMAKPAGYVLAGYVGLKLLKVI